MTETALMQHARQAVVEGLVREHARQTGVDGDRVTLAVNAARNAVKDGRSAWYAYEVIGKSWIDEKMEAV